MWKLCYVEGHHYYVVGHNYVKVIMKVIIIT
jgi:hypothetical protein